MQPDILVRALREERDRATPAAGAGGDAGLLPARGTSAAGVQDARDVVLMSAVASALAEAVTSDQVVDVMTRDLAPQLGAECVHVRLVDDVGAHGWTERECPAEPVPTTGAEALRSDLLLEAVRTGLPLGVTVLSDPGGGDDRQRPAADDARTWIVLPLQADGRTVGAWALDYRVPGQVCSTGLDTFLALADLCAQALARARWWDRARAVGLSLQRALAPSCPPDVPGLSVVTRYVPAEVGNEVGGDFFAVLPLSGGRAAFTLGDVAGHGPGAGARMSQACATLRAYALDGHRPSDVIERTNGVLMSQTDPSFVTCCYGELDLASGGLCLVMAGHLPPLLLKADGRVEFLTLPAGLPLGVTRTEYAESPVALRPGDALLLYTDGLVESREVPLAEGLATLLHAVQRRTTHDLSALADHLLASVRPPCSKDDVALLLLRYDGDLTPAAMR